ncbi:MAG TPA: cysteine--tRNA ligase, partial [Acidimicrobiia bacterium]
KEWDHRFREAVLDDLDFPRAITVIWGLVADEAVAQGERAALVLDWDRVLGLGLAALTADAAGDAEVPAEALVLLDARRAARERRDWAESDRLRDSLKDLGIEVSDTPDGTTLRRREH